MAEGVTPEPSGKDLEAAAGRELEPAHSKELAPYTPQATHGHETKFRFTYAVLAGMGLAAVAAAVIFLAAGKPPTPPQWSQWKPTASGDQALAQIANHIAPAYREPTGEQLVAVEGGLAGAGLSVNIVLLRTPNDFSIAEGKSAVFSLCGLGKFCSIAVGKPSRERTLLLRREALELALYTFHYVGDVKQVAVILPPRPKKKPSQAVYFRKGDVESELSQPLVATLSARTPSIPSLRNGPSRQLLEKLTGDQVYNFSLTQAPDASLLLELAHFNLKKASGAAAQAGTP